MNALVGGGTKRRMKIIATIPGNIHAATRRMRRSGPGRGAVRFFEAGRGCVRRVWEEVVLRVILELLDFKQGA